MKARLNLDQFADITKVTEANRDKLKFKPGRSSAGGPVSIAYYPQGTEFEGDMALFLCRTGQASPSDDECAKALNLTQEQIESLRVEYTMNTLGINRKEDRALYRAGVILGYDEKLQYIKGPKWDEYQAAKEQASKLEDIE